MMISTPVGPGADPALLFATINNAKKYMGIWDTGATNSVISQKVVDEWNLKPIGMAQVHSVTGITLCETFLVSILLPNKVIMQAVRVTKGEISGYDVLIGMDIIGAGDFAVTHKDNKTTFSFRFPSIEEIDFVIKKPEPIYSTKISRNSPCSCGSGKKYKKCCGKNPV
jgi:hypothetical protein